MKFMQRVKATTLAFLVMVLTACSETPREVSEISAQKSVSDVPVSSSENITVLQESSKVNSSSDTFNETSVIQPSFSESVSRNSESSPADNEYCTFIVIETFEEFDELTIAKAVEAYKSSKYYSLAMKEFNEMYSYQDGQLLIDGKVISNFDDTENYEQYCGFASSVYLDRDVAPKIDIKPSVSLNYRYSCNGTERGVVLLKTYLPESYMNWSGTKDFFVPVFVGSNGEMTVLDYACDQDYGYIGLFGSDDGMYHLEFHFGHNQGGQTTVLYSMNDDAPKLELGIGGSVAVNEDGVLIKGFGWDTYLPFYWDGSKFVDEKGSAIDNDDIMAIRRNLE